jgi:hypothetical protein
LAAVPLYAAGPFQTFSREEAHAVALDNVYVVDVQLNKGGFNPSLTIQGIAYWSSATLVEALH